MQEFTNSQFHKFTISQTQNFTNSKFHKFKISQIVELLYESAESVSDSAALNKDR